MSRQLDSDIQYISGVGPKKASIIKSEFNVSTMGQLLRIYPYRYIDKTTIVKIANIVPNTAYIQIQATVMQVVLYNKAGEVALNLTNKNATYPEIKYNLISRMSVIVNDGSGNCEIVFFRGIKYMMIKLQIGSTFLFFGKPSLFGDRLSMAHPEIDNIATSSNDNHIKSNLIGVYSSSEKLKNAGVTSRVMNKIMSNILKLTLNEIEETLPNYILQEYKLVSLKFALYNIHFPQSTQDLERATFRLKFEELFFLQLSLLKQKYIRSAGVYGIKMPKVGEDFNICYKSLPYELTGAQKRVIKEIRHDLNSGHQMNRLLQGDVGSGKTMVAVMAALIVKGNGYQSCIMAPTEVLAQQHFANIQKYLNNTNVTIALLTGSTKSKERKQILPQLHEGKIDIIVGTHALIEDNVVFNNLGLAIIDEQHRFGVEQRAKLWAKNFNNIPPHILVMTATPIPRTLAMTLYGDLDVSVIDELPPNRKKVQTMLITDRKRNALYKFMKEQIQQGYQVFIVYPLIFESESMDYKNLEQGYEAIVDAFPLPEYKVAIVHGRQTNDVKNFNMSAFAAGRANILVSTTVIEVGVDVPNATVMVIESAERFGLSQLHQLRGRVGRGSAGSFCILVKGHKVSKESQKRLELMCQTEDGFVLAEEDMKMRGPGDLEGTAQSGLPVNLNIASLSKDSRILSLANNCANRVLSEDAQLIAEHNMLLKQELTKDKYAIKDYSKIS